MGNKLWITPWQEFAEWWRGRHFTIDAAASRDNAKVRPHLNKCSMSSSFSEAYGPGTYCPNCRRYIGQYYTAQDDGLAQDYGEGDVVFCNPPYNSSGPARIELWLRKAAVTSRKGAHWFLVLPPSIDTRWYHTYVWDNRLGRPREGVDLRFWEGRIHFVDPTPEKRTGARQGTMLVEFLPRKVRSH